MRFFENPWVTSDDAPVQEHERCMCCKSIIYDGDKVMDIADKLICRDCVSYFSVSHDRTVECDACGVLIDSDEPAVELFGSCYCEDCITDAIRIYHNLEGGDDYDD